MSAYDSIDVTITSPVVSPRANTKDNEYYYTIAFPNLLHSSSSHTGADRRISYSDAVVLLRSVTSGGKEREKRAVQELRRAWMEKFRSAAPLGEDTVPYIYFQELLRELIVQRFDAIPGLYLHASTTADQSLLLLSFRPSKTLLSAMADRLCIPVVAMPELDPGESYWSADPVRSRFESTQWSKPDVQEELYRLFLVGKISCDDAQVFETEGDKEDAAMWSRRINALKRFADPEVAQIVQETSKNSLLPVYLPYSSRPSLQYLYRQIEAPLGSFASITPFRVVDNIRLTKAIVDAEFDCDALTEQQILSRHLCTHTHHTDAVDTSIDVLRMQWGSLLSPWRLYRQRLMRLPQLFYYQPVLHIRNYFGEELALYFAFTSSYALALQWLCGGAIILTFLSLLSSSSSFHAYSRVTFCLLNCAFISAFIRKWELKERQLAIEWGVTNLKTQLQPRPQFRGQLECSVISHRLEPHYSPYMRLLKRMASNVLLLVLSLAILTGYYLLVTSRVFEYLTSNSSVSMQMRNVALALLTKCIGTPLAQLSKHLNDWENYKTQVDYDTNLTLKYILLQTANSFGILWYMTFLRPLLSTDDCNKHITHLSCRDQARGSLVVMLVLDLCIAVWELRSPFFGLIAGAYDWSKLRRRWRRNVFFSGKDESDGKRLLLSDKQRSRQHHSPLQEKEDDDKGESMEAELCLDEYEGVMFDYAQVVINFGFITWFAALLPLSCLVGWGVAVLQIRIDAYKLCHKTQRPFPHQKNSIGSWLVYLHFLSLGSVLHNAAFAAMVWMEELSSSTQIRLVHDLLRLDVTREAQAYSLLQVETQTLVLFAVFGLVWSLMSVPDQTDRATARRLMHAQQKQEFLEQKYLKGLDKLPQSVKDTLPPGRVFLNGVSRYIITGNRAEQDAGEEIEEELRELRWLTMDQEKRISALRATQAPVGVLHVDVLGINILPATNTLTKTTDSFLQLSVESNVSPTTTAAAKTLNKPTNTTVIKKDRSPQWNEQFEFQLKSLDDVMTIVIYEWEVLGKKRHIGRTSLPISDVVARTNSTEAAEDGASLQFRSSVENALGPASPLSPSSSSTRRRMASYDIPIDIPENLLVAMHADIAKHGSPRIFIRCGVELQELGALLFQQRQLVAQMETLREKEKEFFQWL